MSQRHKGNIPEISLQMEKPREQQKKHNQIETSGKRNNTFLHVL